MVVPPPNKHRVNGELDLSMAVVLPREYKEIRGTKASKRSQGNDYND